MADLKLSQLLASDPASIQAGAAIWSAKDYISGLKMEWISGTSLRVTSGVAFVEGLGRYFVNPSAITKAGLSLTASTWYHVYLFDTATAGETPDIEIVTTAPAAPYFGTARSKTGDTSRRYVGSIKTDSSGGIYKFKQSGLSVVYSVDQGSAPFRTLSAGAATTSASVSFTDTVPVTGVAVNMRIIQNAAGIVAYLVSADQGPVSSTNYSEVCTDNAQSIYSLVPCDSSQAVLYINTAAGGATYLDVKGYTYER